MIGDFQIPDKDSNGYTRGKTEYDCLENDGETYDCLVKDCLHARSLVSEIASDTKKWQNRNQIQHNMEDNKTSFYLGHHI